MPQPINRVVSDPEVYLEVGILKDKPELAVLVAEIFSVWARIELELSYLVVRVLGADAAPAIAMYSTLTAQHLQLGALQAAAKAALAPDDFNVFLAALAVSDRVQTPQKSPSPLGVGRLQTTPRSVSPRKPQDASRTKLESFTGCSISARC